MNAKNERDEYLKEGLSKKATYELFRLIVQNSRLKRSELEGVFGIGSGTNPRADGGNKPGNTLQQYLKGNRNLPSDKARRIIGIAWECGWLSHKEFQDFRWKLYARELTTAQKKMERRLFTKLEKDGRRLLGSVFSNTEFGVKDVWDSIDKVLAPMLKRLLLEDYFGRRIHRMETFVTPFDSDMDIWGSGTIINLEEGFREELENMF